MTVEEKRTYNAERQRKYRNLHKDDPEYRIMQKNVIQIIQKKFGKNYLNIESPILEKLRNGIVILDKKIKIKSLPKTQQDGQD